MALTGRDIHGAGAIIGIAGGAAFWLLLGAPVKCPDAFDQFTGGCPASEQVTIIGVDPMFASDRDAGAFAVLVAAFVYGCAYWWAWVRRE